MMVFIGSQTMTSRFRTALTAICIFTQWILFPALSAQDKNVNPPAPPAVKTSDTNAAPSAKSEKPDAAPADSSAQRFEDLPSLLELTKKDALKGDAKAQADL